MDDNPVYDITVLGAGPTGLFAAFYAGLRDMKTKVIESLPEAGGQLAVLYPEKFIYDVPGHPKVLAKDLVKSLVEQSQMFAPTFVFDERVERLRRVDVAGEEVWELVTGPQGSSHRSRTVVICGGIGAFAPNRLDRPGVERLEGRGVRYFVQDKRELRGKRLLVIGGGDTAVDWCLNLKDWAQEVTLIHRRDQFRAHEASVTELRNSNVTVLTPWELGEVLGSSSVEGATIFHSVTREERRLEVDAVLVNVGFKAALGPILEWGLELADHRHVRVNAEMATSLPGVFAAGDLVQMDGVEPLPLIVTGFAQAAVAANGARHYLDPSARLMPGHSSELRL